MECDWTIFDKIYCINLFERKDRYKYAQDFFTHNNIPVTFHRVHRHKNGGEQGCFESHRDIIRSAYDKGYEKILIFEDDNIIGKSLTAENLNHINQFLNKNDTWELFYLGIRPAINEYKTKRVEKNIYQIHTYGTYAYAVSRRFMEKFRNAEYLYHPVDSIYVESNDAYGFYPSMFYQADFSSDIQDVLNNSLFHQKSIETYAVVINYEVERLIMIILSIIIIILIVIIYKLYKTK